MRRKKNVLHGIQWRLAVLVVLVLLPLYGMTGWNYYHQRAQALADSRAELQRLINAIVIQQQTYLETTERYLLALSNIPSIYELNEEECAVFFPELISDQPLYANIGMTNAAGDIRCSAIPLAAPVNVADREYYKGAVENGTFSLGVYQIGRVTGKPAVNMGYPVFHPDRGEFMGVLYASLDLEWLNDLAGTLGLPDGSALTLVDQNGTVLVRYPESGLYIGTNASDVPVVQMIQRQGDLEGIIEESEGVDGVSRVYAYAKMPGAGMNAPYAFIGYASAELFLDANEQFARQMITLLLLTLFIVAIAWLSARVLIVEQVRGLQEIDQLKTQFVSLASHQLRSPLTTIRWLTEAIGAGQMGRVGKKQQEALGQIQTSTERLLTLVRELLNISRIESDRIQVNPELTDVVELAEDVILEMKPQAEQKRITIDSDLKQQVVMIRTDPLLVRQVIHNLISNAVKYTPEAGTVSVRVGMQGPDVRVDVTDTGIGIPLQEQARLFEQFFRASNAREAGAEGTGLGLYLVKSLVELLGGTLGFRSRPGKETVFWFTLPARGIEAKQGTIKLNT